MLYDTNTHWSWKVVDSRFTMNYAKLERKIQVVLCKDIHY